MPSHDDEFINYVRAYAQENNLKLSAVSFSGILEQWKAEGRGKINADVVIKLPPHEKSVVRLMALKNSGLVKEGSLEAACSRLNQLLERPGYYDAAYDTYRDLALEDRLLASRKAGDSVSKRMGKTEQDFKDAIKFIEEKAKAFDDGSNNPFAAPYIVSPKEVARQQQGNVVADTGFEAMVKPSEQGSKRNKNK